MKLVRTLDPAARCGATLCAPRLPSLSVALGVAVVVAIDLAGDAATGSFARPW